jgi:riboflavin synthase
MPPQVCEQPRTLPRGLLRPSSLGAILGVSRSVFTGIVESLGVVRELSREGPGCRLVIHAPALAGGAAHGDSIAVNGVCLTVIASDSECLAFEVGPETLAKTNLGELTAPDRVNLERALLPSTRLSGHFVQGHVDGIARISQRQREGDWEWLEFTADSELTDQMAPKGSLSVDGVSLTLVAVSPGRFRVMLIPHTLQATTLGLKPVGAAVNIELDILGKYVAQHVRKMLADDKTQS